MKRLLIMALVVLVLAACAEKETLTYVAPDEVSDTPLPQAVELAAVSNLPNGHYMIEANVASAVVGSDWLSLYFARDTVYSGSFLRGGWSNFRGFTIWDMPTLTWDSESKLPKFPIQRGTRKVIQTAGCNDCTLKDNCFSHARTCGRRII